MSETKSKLRLLLDLVENAGFTMTDYHEHDKTGKTDITIHHDDMAKTTAAGEIVALFENNAYRILDYGVVEEAACVTIAPKPESTLQGV
jgi:hypothetical protein